MTDEIYNKLEILLANATDILLANATVLHIGLSVGEQKN